MLKIRVGKLCSVCMKPLSENTEMKLLIVVVKAEVKEAAAKAVTQT